MNVFKKIFLGILQCSNKQISGQAGLFFRRYLGNNFSDHIQA